MLNRLITTSVMCVIAIATGIGAACATVPSSCRTIRLGYGSWVDNKVQNAVYSSLAEPLGYDVKINMYSQEVIYRGLANNQLDVYLDNWMPSEKKMREPYTSKQEIDVMGPDLVGAKYTLAVPTYLYKEGLKNFSDIHKFAAQLHHRIYGIEPGNDGNEHVLAMIKHNTYDLGDFHLVQSSAAGMLSELARRYKHHKAIVFLGWQPHPMNIEYNIRYLSGGAAAFGPDKGAAKSFILTRHGYAKDCPNMGKLLSQFRLPVNSESRMMYDVVVKHEKAVVVAEHWISGHPAWLKKTVAGVTTVEGKPALPAIRKAL